MVGVGMIMLALSCWMKDSIASSVEPAGLCMGRESERELRERGTEGGREGRERKERGERERERERESAKGVFRSL